MKKTLNPIPETWELVTLDKIGIIVSGGTPATKEPEFWNGDIPWITPADLSNYDQVYISKGKRNISQIGLQYSSAIALPENSVIFSSRAPIGYVAITKNLLATNQGFKSLILSKSINSKFVYFYLKTIKELAESVASGTTFLELSSTKFKQIPFPLPPIEEQQRIVAKIEELFSELDKNISLLSESLVKSDLTKSKFLDRYLSDIPNKNIRLAELTDSISYGYTAKSFGTPIDQSVHYLRITDIQDGKIDWESVPYCIADKDDISKYSVEPDDILFARSGNTVGKTILITNPPKSLYASYLIKIRCNRDILSPQYLSYFFQSHFYWRQIRAGITGIGQPNFNGTKVSDLLIPIVSLSEQNTIVVQIESNFLEIEKLKKEIEISINKTKLLKSKILQDAFSGKLSDQLKTDIDVKELLKRIELEKEEYLKSTKELSESSIKLKRAKIDLAEIIHKKFEGQLFSYSELFEKVNISKINLSLEFEKLEKNKSIISHFDEITGTLKYKLK